MKSVHRTQMHTDSSSSVLVIPFFKSLHKNQETISFVGLHFEKHLKCKVRFKYKLIGDNNLNYFYLVAFLIRRSRTIISDCTPTFYDTLLCLLTVSFYKNPKTNAFKIHFINLSLKNINFFPNLMFNSKHVKGC